MITLWMGLFISNKHNLSFNNIEMNISAINKQVDQKRISQEQQKGQQQPYINSSVESPFSFHIQSIQTSSFINKFSCLLISILVILLISSLIISTSRPNNPQTFHNNHPSRLLSSTKQLQNSLSIKVTKLKMKQIMFPQVLWIQSQYPLDRQSMITSVFVNNWLQFTKLSQMEIRFVNNFNAFDYLSKEMAQEIIELSQKSKDTINIGELIRLGLLIEHGGLSFKMDNVVLLQGFAYIKDITKRIIRSSVVEQKKHVPEIILFYNEQISKFKISDEVIYCKKEAKILREIFGDLKRILVNGEWPYRYLNGVKNQDHRYRIEQFRDVIGQLISAKIQNSFTNIQQFSSHFNVLALEDNNNPLALKQPDSQFYDDARIDRQQFVFKHCNVPIYMSNLNTFKLMLIEENLVNNMNSWASPSGIFANQILKIQSNRWIIEPLEQFSPVDFCIISLKPQKSERFVNEMLQAIKHLNKQGFQKWEAIFFVQNLSKRQIDYKIEDRKVKAVNASVYEGLNFQRAATQYCNSKSVAVLINYDQSFAKQDSLQSLSSQFINRNTLGAYFPTTTTNSTHNLNMIAFDPSNLKNLNANDLHNHYISIKNHFRAIRLQNYRYLSHLTLHDFNGRYYDIQIVLMALLQLSSNFEKCKKTQSFYHIKRLWKKINVGVNMVEAKDAVLMTGERMSINFGDKLQYKMIFHNELCKGITQFNNIRRYPLEKLFYFNNGSQFETRGSLNKYEIPKIIHTIVLHEQKGSFKKQLIKNNKKMHPQYKYVIWKASNINIKNFPTTYHLIMKLLDFNSMGQKFDEQLINNSDITYTFAESIKKLMKNEILYRFGGFYVDQNYMFFKENTLDQFTSYKAMVISNREPDLRFKRYSGVIGCMKGFQNVLRINSNRNLTTFNLFSSEMNSPSDNFMYGELIQGDQQFDKDIAQPPLYMFYPFTEEKDNKCVAEGKVEASELLFQNKKYLKNCQTIYNGSWGVYFFGQS